MWGACTGMMISGAAVTTGYLPVYATSPDFHISEDTIGKNIVRVQGQRQPLYWVPTGHKAFFHTPGHFILTVTAS